jgi:oxygen-independent coproporphyrinogen-3 oxidase
MRPKSSAAKPPPKPKPRAPSKLNHQVRIIGGQWKRSKLKVLEAAGFDTYEVSNHARGVAARSAHNLHVWRGGDYLGLGPGAHGRLTLDGVRTATVAHRRIGDYAAGVQAGAPWAEVERLDAAGAAEERLLLGLRTVEGAPVGVLGDLGLSPEAEPTADLIADGFLAVMDGRLVATPRGRPVLDGVLKALLT